MEVVTATSSAGEIEINNAYQRVKDCVSGDCCVLVLPGIKHAQSAMAGL